LGEKQPIIGATCSAERQWIINVLHALKITFIIEEGYRFDSLRIESNILDDKMIAILIKYHSTCYLSRHNIIINTKNAFGLSLCFGRGCQVVNLVLTFVSLYYIVSPYGETSIFSETNNEKGYAKES
jgi:hypothetical protein